jgi:hypothetical protein
MARLRQVVTFILYGYLVLSSIYGFIQEVGKGDEPAPVWAVALWLVMTLSIAAYAIYQVLPAQRDNPILQQTGWWSVLFAALVMLTDLVPMTSHSNFILAFMAGLLVILSFILMKMYRSEAPIRGGDFWYIQVPFGIFWTLMIFQLITFNFVVLMVSESWWGVVGF